MKRIVTVQDISCFGKCSLTVALPIISAMGVEAAVVPTAVLSTHTGGFSGFTFRDLSGDIPDIFRHWEKEKIHFDAIYTGYLGSYEQIDIMREYISKRRKGTLAFVDPAMGDNGVLYTGFTPEFARHMASLCSVADVIVPNLTEAAFMLGIDYRESGYDKAYIEDILVKLAELGAKKVVLTGVSFSEEELGVAMYDSEKEEFFYYFSEKVSAKFHGTGDVFASTCVGALMNGMSLSDALCVAVDFVLECIRVTLPEREECWYSVQFEKAIPKLLKMITKKGGQTL